MDLQAQVAARRAELARMTKQAKDDNAKAEAERKALERDQRRAALDLVAEDVSNDDLKIVRSGDSLSLVKQSSPPLDTEGLRRSEIIKLIRREARSLWTPAENWQVIGSIVAGVFLLFLYGLGFIFFIYAMWRSETLHRKYVDEILLGNPELEKLRK